MGFPCLGKAERVTCYFKRRRPHQNPGRADGWPICFSTWNHRLARDVRWFPAVALEMSRARRSPLARSSATLSPAWDIQRQFAGNRHLKDSKGHVISKRALEKQSEQSLQICKTTTFISECTADLEFESPQQLKLSPLSPSKPGVSNSRAMYIIIKFASQCKRGLRNSKDEGRAAKSNVQVTRALSI